MINLYELEQLVAFADLGTLSKVSEHLNISQPTITRSMQNLEAEFGVKLFIRSKNKIELNKNGQLAVTYARGLLNDAKNAVDAIKAYDKKHANHYGLFLRSCTIMDITPQTQLGISKHVHFI